MRKSAAVEGPLRPANFESRTATSRVIEKMVSSSSSQVPALRRERPGANGLSLMMSLLDALHNRHFRS